MHSVEDYAAVGQMFKGVCFKKLTLSPSSDDLRGIFNANPKLVVAMNHGPSISPTYIAIAVGNLYLENGGAERKFMGVIWKYAYRIPGFRKAAQLITQVDEAVNFDGFLALFQNTEANDFFVMPEGENCAFGNGYDVEDFLSSRFLEVAIRAEVPVLLCVHYGAHLLGKAVTISDRATKLFQWMPKKNYERLQLTKTLNVPWPRGRLPELQITFKLYHPSLTLNDMSADKTERTKQLNREGDSVRRLMQEMVETLKAEGLR
ncbi:MAG: hypothetical protein COA99_14665 [Moraxellaceae bacterium]|nr:MAG: hypothetical protein COA99_14665 [Moraxellaceae bacterium]